MPHVPLVLQDAQHGANRRVARRVGEALLDLGGGGLAQGVEHVHDLALAAAERGGVRGLGHRAGHGRTRGDAAERLC
jgi:hypothetical protein